MFLITTLLQFPGGGGGDALDLFIDGTEIGDIIEAAGGGDLGDGQLGGDQRLFRLIDAGEGEVILEGLAGDPFEAAGEVAIA